MNLNANTLVTPQQEKRKPSYRSVFKTQGGKSGQHRAAYFLTGRHGVGDDSVTDSATEN